MCESPQQNLFVLKHRAGAKPRGGSCDLTYDEVNPQQKCPSVAVHPISSYQVHPQGNYPRDNWSPSPHEGIGTFMNQTTRSAQKQD